MSRFGCSNNDSAHHADDEQRCSDMLTCNHCQLLEVLHELTDYQHRLIELLKEKLA